MSFRITGLAPALFQHLIDAPAPDLAEEGAQRVVIDAPASAPCRISLEDAAPGERVLLLSYLHQSAATPYRQQGPIFVREKPVARFDAIDQIPPAFRARMLSLRGFDTGGAMIEADLAIGAEAPAMIAAFFSNADVAYIHAHYARRGCYAGLIERA